MRIVVADHNIIAMKVILESIAERAALLPA
jgi:hypothetical protein